jgi:hypothetical protein
MTRRGLFYTGLQTYKDFTFIPDIKKATWERKGNYKIVKYRKLLPERTY